MEEQEYDEIMSEAEEIYKYQISVRNPYAFHLAFEFAQRKIKDGGINGTTTSPVRNREANPAA